MCRVAHEGVIFIFQSELALPMVSLFTIRSFWESITVLRCVTSSLYVYSRQVQFSRTNRKLFAAKQKRKYQGHLHWDSCYIRVWYMKNAMCAFSAQGDRGSWLESALWGSTLCLTAPGPSTWERHLIIIHSLYSSQLIDESTGADNPNLVYIWLWKSLNEFFTKLTFLISFCLGS